jgi:hypothetical protein
MPPDKDAVPTYGRREGGGGQGKELASRGLIAFALHLPLGLRKHFVGAFPLLPIREGVPMTACVGPRCVRRPAFAPFVPRTTRGPRGRFGGPPR